jgi:hypothetical protein
VEPTTRTCNPQRVLKKNNKTRFESRIERRDQIPLGRRATEVRQEILLTDQSPCVDRARMRICLSEDACRGWTQTNKETELRNLHVLLFAAEETYSAAETGRGNTGYCVTLSLTDQLLAVLTQARFRQLSSPFAEKTRPPRGKKNGS